MSLLRRDLFPAVTLRYQTGEFRQKSIGSDQQNFSPRRTDRTIQGLAPGPVRATPTSPRYCSPAQTCRACAIAPGPGESGAHYRRVAAGRLQTGPIPSAD